MNSPSPRNPCTRFTLPVTRELCVSMPEFGEKKRNYLFDVDPGPRDPCVVAAMDKFTWTTEILWRKREGIVTL